MDIYSRCGLCQILDTECNLEHFNFDISPPPDAKYNGGNEGHVPWNKNQNCKGIIVGNKSAHLNGIFSRFKIGKIPHNKGISPSDDIKEKISKTLSGRKRPEHSQKMKGKKCHSIPHSEETKRILAEKSSMYCWITNGELNTRVLKNSEIPFGWKGGRKL
jgi:hypothetical protein